MNPPTITSLRRLVNKAIARAIGGKAWAHAYGWRPFLELGKARRDVEGKISYKGRVVAPLFHSSILSEKKPRSIYLVGSGPSIAGIDFSLVEDETALLLNGAIVLIGEAISRPLAIAIEDERFVHRHFSMIQEKVPAAAMCLLSVEAIRAICERLPGWLDDKNVILIDNIRKPYGAPYRSVAALKGLSFAVLSDDGSAGISLDPDRGVFQGGSVVISALQFALQCEPASIGLFGIDISNADQPRFYEIGAQRAKSGVARAQQRILAHFSLARRIAAERGVVLLNFSPVSVLCSHGFPHDARFQKAG